MDINDLPQLSLGKLLPYVDQYDAGLLQPIERHLARQHLPQQSFIGADVWTAFELSWLSSDGKPHVAIAEFIVPAGSENIIESKSLKYYLNSFNQTTFDSRDAVLKLIQKDLSWAAGAQVEVVFYDLHEYAMKRANSLGVGQPLDDFPLSVTANAPSADILQVQDAHFEGVWYSHLLKSNCPVTGQPDWASIWLSWSGRAVAPSSLLGYLAAYRRHQDFHENCVERVFCDLQQLLQPQKLWVYARYTRRGGLDINPFRSSVPMTIPAVMGERQ